MPQFKDFSTDQIKKIQAERLRQVAFIRPEVEVLQIGEGEHAFRIIPPLAEETWTDSFFLTAGTHWLGKSILCPRSIPALGQDCPVCQEFFERRKRGELPQELRGLKPVYRHLIWVWYFPLDGRQPPNHPHVYPCPDTLLDSILRAAQDRITKALIPFLDPQRGRLVMFTRTGTGLNTRYVNVALDQNELPVPEEVLGQVRLWKDTLVVPSQEELEAALEDYLARAEPGAVIDEQQHAEGDIPTASTQQVTPQSSTTQADSGGATITQEATEDNLDAIRLRIQEMRQRMQGNG